MNHYKSESKWEDTDESDQYKFNQELTSSKSFDFQNHRDPTDYWEKCKKRMKLEAKQNQNIPLTESEKRELNFFKMEMMIFDVRYKELQEHGTLPNWFRFSLQERLTDEHINKFIEDYEPCKAAANTICIIGASSLTADDSLLNGVEKFHVKAVNKVISKMEKHNFIHVTTVEEGFEKLHEMCKLYDLRIQEHSPQECYYCIKDEESKDSPSSGGTFKTFAGKFASIYEKMGKKLKSFMFKDKSEFEVVDEDSEVEQSLSNVDSSYPDFDPNKFDNQMTAKPPMLDQKSLSVKTQPDPIKLVSLWTFSDIKLIVWLWYWSQCLQWDYS